MLIKKIIYEDFNDYKKPSMFIAFPYCSFKCEKDCGEKVCQNGELATSPNIEISIDKMVNRYLENNLTGAIVCGGLEPFDSWNDLYILVQAFRQKTDDDIVIYTGYYKKEIEYKIKELGKYKNIIVKYGRYIPNEENVYDELLGVKLASKNQYAERVN